MFPPRRVLFIRLIRASALVCLFVSSSLWAQEGYTPGKRPDGYFCSSGWLGAHPPVGDIFTQCAGGTQLSPLECCEQDLHEPVYTVDRTIHCEDGSTDCAEIVGEYNACAGPFSSLVVDEEDNVYFWAGRWQLHSLDKRGNFRWRFELCRPETERNALTLDRCDSGEETYELTCRTANETATMKSMVLDYHGTLYFFSGDVLYGLDSKTGEVLVEQKLFIPGAQTNPGEMVLVANGDMQPYSRNSYQSGGALVLRPDGLLQAPYIVRSVNYEPKLFEQPEYGLLTLTRNGNVLEVERPFPAQTNVDVSYMQVVGWQDTEQQHHLAYSVDRGYKHYDLSPESEPSNPKADTAPRFGVLGEGGNDAAFRESTTYQGGSKLHARAFRSVAISPNKKRAYYLSQNGAVVARDVKTGEVRIIFKYPGNNTFTWQSRVTFDEDGHLWAISDPENASTPTMMQLDVELLWDAPQVHDYLCPWFSASEHCVQFSEPGQEYQIDYRDVPGVMFYLTGWRGSWSTPLLTRERIYAPIAGLWALDAQTKETVWRLGDRTMAAAPAMLSDGTLVVGQGIHGHIFFIREKDVAPTPLSAKGWSRAFHDNYQSNHLDHPMRWDRSKPEPYPHVRTLPPVPQPPAPEEMELEGMEIDAFEQMEPDVEMGLVPNPPVPPPREKCSVAHVSSLPWRQGEGMGFVLVVLGWCLRRRERGLERA